MIKNWLTKNYLNRINKGQIMSPATSELFFLPILMLQWFLLQRQFFYTSYFFWNSWFLITFVLIPVFKPPFVLLSSHELQIVDDII